MSMCQCVNNYCQSLLSIITVNHYCQSLLICMWHSSILYRCTTSNIVTDLYNILEYKLAHYFEQKHPFWTPFLKFRVCNLYGRMNTSVYVYQCICIPMYIYTNVYIYQCICIPVYMYTSEYVYQCICILVYMYIY